MKKVDPCVGIIFLVGDHLHIDATPLSKAGRYSDHLIHEGGHPEFWDTLGLSGEYDEVPRGRVAYSTRDERFELLADRCILRRPEIVERIKKRLHLPDVTVAGDSHYVCPKCMRGK